VKRWTTILWLALVLLGIAPVARGQEMSVRVYIVPVDSQIINGTEYRGPLYLQWRFNPDGLDVIWSMRDYGGIGETAMIVAADVTQEQHDYLSVQAGVYPIPENIDDKPSPAELAAFEAHLETMYIPADWLLPNMTWRECLRTILGMFATAGKYAVIVGDSILNSGITLNMQFQNFPQYVQDALEQIATNLGYPWDEVKTNWTARIVLKWFADQWPSGSFRFGNLITV